ncbi:MAG: DUF732 domain-containing protein [Mycobacterium sp.]
MKRLILLTSAAAMVCMAVPAQAEPANTAAPTNGDAIFLTALRDAGFLHRGPTQAIAAARAVCKLMDDGNSPVDTVSAVQSTNPGFTMDHATRFAKISAVAYCPDHL